MTPLGEGLRMGTDQIPITEVGVGHTLEIAEWHNLYIEVSGEPVRYLCRYIPQADGDTAQ